MTSPPNIENEIKDAFPAISLLLVFIMAYFSALYPQIREKLTEETPNDKIPKGNLADKLGTYQRLLLGIAVSILLVLLLISSAVIKVVSNPRTRWPWSKDYAILHGGLILDSIFLVGLLIVIMTVFVQARRRKKELR